MAIYGTGQRKLGSGITMPGIAGQAVLRGRVVYMSAADGLWYPADSDAVATLPAVGITMEQAISAGQVIQILLVGIIGRGDWTWTRGDTLYASGTAGVMTQVAPANAQPIGVALTATLIYVNPTLSLLSASVGAHILATTGPHTNTLPLIDLEVGVQGEIIHRGAADWEALGVGAAGLVLTAGGAGANVSWGAAGVGADQDIFYPAPDPDDFKGTYASMLLTDGQSTLIRQTFYLPANYDGNWSVDVIVIPDATGNLRWGVATNFAEVCNDEDYQTHTDSIALGQSAVTADEVECLDITAGLTGALAGDLVGIEFTRDGGNASDTVNDQVHYIGIVLRAPPEP